MDMATTNGHTMECLSDVVPLVFLRELTVVNTMFGRKSIPPEDVLWEAVAPLVRNPARCELRVRR